MTKKTGKSETPKMDSAAEEEWDWEIKRDRDVNTAIQSI
jgi:hypothetical protein